jgi:hypothetical protein
MKAARPEAPRALADRLPGRETLVESVSRAGTFFRVVEPERFAADVVAFLTTGNTGGDKHQPFSAA